MKSVHEPGQKLCMKERGRRKGYESSPFACDHLGAIQRLHLFVLFPLRFALPLKQNSYFSACNPGGLDFENSMGKSGTRKPLSTRFGWDLTYIRRRVRDNKERLYLVSGLITAIRQG
jgi:hypothetical protein